MFVSLKDTKAMNTTELLNKSLAWLGYTETAATSRTRNASNHLQPAESFCADPFLDLKLAECGVIRNGFGYEIAAATDQATTAVDLQQVAPMEIYILTQLILNTLNIDHNIFHNMSEIPGLEGRAWDQLGEVASYLLRQGWVEANANANSKDFYLKLTIQGKVYLRTTNAWA
jgi:hypothetical protein